MIVVVDYGRGNLFSLAQALKQVGAAFKVSADPADVAAADKIVLPGVGAFADCMSNLRDRGLAESVVAASRRGTPLLGICVGCQILLDRGEEFGVHAGLGLIAGTVRRLPAPRESDPDPIRIPNVGWRTLSVSPHARLFGDLRPSPMMYFVHSYAPEPTDASVVSARIATNGRDATAAFERGRIYGVQFHPEKSGPEGLSLLAGFVNRG